MIDHRSARPPYHMRPISSTALLVDFALARGLSIASVLRHTGIRDSQLTHADAEVTFAQQVAVLRNIVHGIGDEAGFGLMAGLTCRAPQLGAVERAVMSQPTVRQAFETAIRFAERSCSLARHTIERRGDEIELVRDDSMLPAEIRRFALEHDIGALVTMQRDTVQMRQPIKRAETTVGADPVYEGIAVVLGVRDLAFDARRTVLVLDPALLDLPMPQANPRFRGLQAVRDDNRRSPASMVGPDDADRS
ncbi:AraC family transcriptional regulator ligand-binding domain-containing protein [Nocardia tengchongensis]|uniref:AraC family transcriptional regulator ligand-binding domain-containing protein n=1 Tax=Nocardia tengchongensis TaxID=2055889 RepID=UPI00367E277D